MKLTRPFYAAYVTFLAGVILPSDTPRSFREDVRRVPLAAQPPEPFKPTLHDPLPELCPAPKQISGLFAPDLSDRDQIMCLLVTRSMVRDARMLGLFKSIAWRELGEIAASMSERELGSFGGIDLNNFKWLKCNVSLARYEGSHYGLANLRELRLFRSFMNIAGPAGLSRIIKQGFSAEEKAILRRDVATFQRLHAQTSVGGGVYVLYQPWNYIHVESISGMRFTTGQNNRGFGKWEVLAPSAERAIRVVERLMPCFASGALPSVLKFDLNPFMKGVYRVIVYSSERDPKTKAMLSRLTDDNLLWVYEWQSYEGMALKQALFSFADVAMRDDFIKPTELELRRLLDNLDDAVFMKGLGMSEFQIKVLKRALFLKQHTDLSDQAIYTARDFLKSPLATTVLLVAAMRDKEAFKKRVSEANAILKKRFRD